MTREGGDSDINMSGLKGALPTDLSDAERAAMVSMIQERLDTIVGASSGYLESLPPKVQGRVSALQEIQKEHDALEAKFFEEKAALEAKYQKLYEPLYAKRAGIVDGTVEPPQAAEAEAKEGEDVKGVPEFWLTALKNNDIIQEQITERDEGALKHLKDVKWAGLEEGKGFKLEFYFEENSYFKNKVLTKTYFMIDDEEPILEKAEGTEIEWNSGKNLTQKIMKKKPKKGAKNAKPITKVEDCESFFNFFSPPQVPGDEEEIDEEEAEMLQEQMEADYEIGSTLKEKIVPHAVSWFTGEAKEEEYDDEDDEEGEDDEGDDDEDDEEDDDDDEDDEDTPVKSSKGTPAKVQKRAQPTAEGEQPPECKQQ